MLFDSKSEISTNLPAANESRKPNRLVDLWVGILIFATAFIVYTMTMCPTIYTGDDGDFITAMATFGVPHPTGYPLFCLLGRLFLQIVPWGNPAFKINLMTAFFGAASIGFVYRFLALLLASRGHRYLAAMGALLFAFSPTMWQQSLSCEVYSLTALFLSALLCLAVCWQREVNNNRLLFVFAFVYGLALTNHLTIALLLPAFLIFVLWQRPALLGREWRTLLLLVPIFVLPLTLYAYLPIAAHNPNAPVNWGLPDNFQFFWEHITGDEFRPLMFQSATVALRQATDYLGYLRNEYGIWMLLIAPAGVWFLWTDTDKSTDRATHRTLPTRLLCCLLLAVWGITAFYAFNYEIFDIYVYYIPSYLVAACLIALGSSACITGFQNWRKVSTEERQRIMPLLAIVMLMIPLVPMSLHYEDSSKSGNYLEDDFTYNILQSCPKDSLVITNSNVIFALWYRRFVLGERQDVVPVHQGLTYGLMFWNAWYAKHLYRMYPDLVNTYPPHKQPSDDEIKRGIYLIKLMRRAVERGVPVIILPDPRFDSQSKSISGANKLGRASFNDQVAGAGMVRVAWGVCDRVYLKGQEPTAEQVVRENLKLRPLFRFRGIYDHTWAFADPMQRHIPRRYLDADASLAAVAEKAKRYDIAVAALERARKIDDWDELRQAEVRCQQKATTIIAK